MGISRRGMTIVRDPLNVAIEDEGFGAIAEYAAVPIAFEVRTVLDVVEADGLMLRERRVEVPWMKDYDALDGGPAAWPQRFDVSRWGLLVARSGGRVAGGAAVAFDTPDVRMLEERRDLAVLWDIRVAPEMRGRGVGAALFRAAETWAAARGCRRMKIETQNINVPACRFYASRGCVLGAIHRFAYPDLPGEAMLLWYRELEPASPSTSTFPSP
jgi:GNAT superfamily N-acetyltransferase